MDRINSMFRGAGGTVALMHERNGQRMDRIDPMFRGRGETVALMRGRDG